jgi:hypothetical protein
VKRKAATMQEQTTNTISIILILLGSILMLAIGFGLISFKYLFVAGIVYFILFVLFIEGISKKLFDDIL